MISFRVRTVSAVLALALVTAMTQVASAQPGGRRGGGFGFGMPSVMLATLDQVQSELKMTDDQQAKVAEITDQLRGAGRENRRQAANDAASKLAEVLDKNQVQRLAGIVIQVSGPQALNDPIVVDQLNLSDEQKTKLNDIQTEHWQAVRDAWDQTQDLSREERREKFSQLRDEAGKKLLAVLTPEQQTEFEQLKGEPIDIDMSQFRGRGPRGG